MSLFAPEEYSSRLERAAGEGLCADDAKAYAGGSRPLRDDECPHDELDGGICIACGTDCADREIERAEAASDSKEDR